MSALRVAFTLADAPGDTPPSALSTQHWIGGPMGGGANAQPAGPEQHLTLCDLPAGTSEGIASASGQWGWFGAQILPGEAEAPDAARGLLMNVMDIDPAHEDEFNEWYDAEHMPRLADVPGFILGRRFRAIGGATPRYAAIYHLAERGTCQTPVWTAAATTPWTLRMRRLTTGNRRMTFYPAP